MTVETVSKLDGDQVKGRQSMAPNYLEGIFLGDDADNHDFKVDARGKGRFSVAVENPTDTGCTAAVYGMHSKSADVGDSGVHLIGSAWAVATVSRNYETYNDPFPYYLVRVVFGGAPTDAVKKNVTTNINFSAF